MIPIAVAFLLLVAVLVRQYGAPRLAAYLVGLVVFWLSSFTASVLIIGNQSAFFLIGPRLLPLDWFMIRGIPALVRRSFLLVTMLNISTAGFYFCFLAFALSFSFPPSRQVKTAIWILAIPVLLFVTFFDPALIRYASRLNATRADFHFVELAPLFRAGRLVARVVFGLYLAGGVAILMRYLRSRPRTRRVQRAITFMVLATSIFALMYAFFFFRSPQILVIPTFRPPYVRIGSYEIPTSLRLLRVFPLTQIVVLVFFSAALAGFLRLATSESFVDTRIRHTLRVASLGSRVIGHRMKNLLFAVEAEINAIRSRLPAEYEDVRGQLTATAQMCRRTYLTMGKTIDMLQAPRLRMELTDVADVATTAASTWNGAFPDADVCVLSHEPVSMAYIDRVHFEEVMVNLLNNAYQAVLPGTCAVIHVEILADNHWIAVRITDHGSGIDADTAADMFDPFFTGSGGATNWGIGLTYCRSVIQAHDGEIEIRNASHGGAEVEIGLPRAYPWR